RAALFRRHLLFACRAFLLEPLSSDYRRGGPSDPKSIHGGQSACKSDGDFSASGSTFRRTRIPYPAYRVGFARRDGFLLLRCSPARSPGRVAKPFLQSLVRLGCARIDAFVG